MTRPHRRCGHGPGSLSPEDQAVVDAFRAYLAHRKMSTPVTDASSGEPAPLDSAGRSPTGRPRNATPATDADKGRP